ncbi:MAG TPA: S8 family serine peptidase [Myxococcaceae bacterium]|jgi:subtilisin-like proprotein convertase family protein
MPQSIVPPTQPKQYVVELPSSQESISGLSNLKQSDVEKNLSTGGRKVVTLDEFQLAELKRQNPAAIVFENARVHVPSPEELGAKPVFDVVEPGQQGAVGPQAINQNIVVHGADKLHEQGIKGNSSPFSPIVVTVDTGVAPHKFLESDQRGLKFWDVFDNKEEAWNDGHNHGTHVSGIMFADSANQKGMAPDANFIGVKVLDDTGNGTIASVMSGLEKAAAYYDEIAKPAGRPMVLNMSLGDDEVPPTAQDELHKKLKEILDARPGMVIAIAAGNAGPGANTIGTPGNFQHPQAVTVAAANTRGTISMDDDTAATFSSRGGNDVSKGQDALRNGGIMADGSNVVSTVGSGTSLQSMSGTSMASPHVAGAAALLYDLAGKMQAEGTLKVPLTEINPLKLLRESALDHANINADIEGAGELDVAKAAKLLVERYGNTEGPTDPTPVETKKTATPNLPIGDLQTVTSTLDVPEAMKLTNATVDLDIGHTWRGDLVVSLIAPSGKEIVLANKEGGSADNVTGSFDVSEALKGESAQGTWTLKVADTARQDVGTLKSWSLNLKGTAPQPQ